MATQPIDPNARFERQKLMAKQEANAEKQVAQEAINRRFAASGRLNSGAAIKNQQILEKNAGDAVQRRLQAIQDSQDTDQLRRDEISEGRKFQTSEREATQMFGRGEREASQGFMSDQARIGREFSTSERLGGQDFMSLQARLGRDFATQERLGSQAYATGERESGQKFQKEEVIDLQDRQWREQLNQQMFQFREQMAMAAQEFELNKKVTDFNLEMGKMAADDQYGRNTWQKFVDPMNMFGKDAGKIGGWIPGG